MRRLEIIRLLYPALNEQRVSLFPTHRRGKILNVLAGKMQKEDVRRNR